MTTSQILQLPGMDRARRHLAVEIGGRRARQHVAKLAGMVRRLDAQAARQHLRIDLHAGGLSGHPRAWEQNQAVLNLVAWLIGRDGLIQYEIDICSVGSYRADATMSWRADVILRRAQRLRQQRTAAHEAKAAEYLETLPADVRALAETARPACLRLSADGLAVTECLHDVGGTLTSRVGANAFRMPASLGQMQAEHDRVYHPDRVLDA